jgi:hypothetical protein
VKWRKAEKKRENSLAPASGGRCTPEANEKREKNSKNVVEDPSLRKKMKENMKQSYEPQKNDPFSFP